MKASAFKIFNFQLDLTLKDGKGGDISSFIPNGEWDLIGKINFLIDESFLNAWPLYFKSNHLFFKEKNKNSKIELMHNFLVAQEWFFFINIRTKAPTTALQGGSYACCSNTLWGQLKAFPSNSSLLPQIPFFLHMKCRCSWWQAWSSLWVLSWALCGHYIYHTYTQKNFVLLFQLDCPMCADFFDGFTWFHTATWLRRKADIR